MRQTFFKYLNKEKQTKSGSAGGSAKKTWRFMNALNFLKCEATESGGTDNLVMYIFNIHFFQCHTFCIAM